MSYDAVVSPCRIRKNGAALLFLSSSVLLWRSWSGGLPLITLVSINPLLRLLLYIHSHTSSLFCFLALLYYRFTGHVLYVGRLSELLDDQKESCAFHAQCV